MLKKRTLITVGVIIGCIALMISGFLVEQKKRMKEVIVFDVFDSQANFQGIQSGWFAALIEKQFGIQLNIIAPNVSGGGDTMYETRVASGNVGDIIICKGNEGKLQNLVEAGLVLDISDYIKNTSLLKDYEAAVRALNDPIKEGAVYAIPSSVSKRACDEPNESRDPTFGPYLRYDIYAAAGYPEMKTLDDLLEVLNLMQEIHPENEAGDKVYAFSFFKDWDASMMNAAKQPACFYGYDEYGFVLAKADGSDYQDITDPNSFYMQNIRMFYEANQRGLVDPESVTQSYSEMYEKYARGEVLYSPWPWLGKSAYNSLENRTAGKGFMFVPIEDMQILSIGCNPEGDDSLVIAVGSGCKDPKRAAEFIAWLYSPEEIYANSAAQLAGTAGPEGLGWYMDNGQPVFTDFGMEAMLNGSADVPKEWGGGKWEDGISQLNYKAVSLVDEGPNGYPYDYATWESFRKMESTTLDLAWQNRMDAADPMDYLKKNDKLMVLPGGSVQTEEESNELTTIRGQCKKIIVDLSWKMVFARNESVYRECQNEMRMKLQSIGYEQVLNKDMADAKKTINAKLSKIKALDQK